MKSTDTFKNTISAYLTQYATQDELFAEKLQNPAKNIDDCITYILNTVQKSGCNGFTDDEVYNMAIHYYDEENIEIGKAIQGKVVVNHHVEVTAEEKAEMKQKALDDILAEERRKLTQKKTPTTTVKKTEPQADLFGTQASLF
jgi:hypothetical protein